MDELLNLEDFPLDHPQSAAYASLVAHCRDELARDGMFSLKSFLHPHIAAQVAKTLTPLMETEAFQHKRSHNIYFKDHIDGLPKDHPAQARVETKNQTLCADQIGSTQLSQVYEWRPLRQFLAAVMGKDALHTMADPLARVNVMSYGQGDALNWHFDRSEFTTTLLLQAPQKGGAFEYRTDLRTATDPNYDGVAKLLNGDDPLTQQMSLTAGTLNVFQGINTPHRVTPVEGTTNRMIAVFSYYDQPGVRFSKEEQTGFYGRTLLGA